jgi:TolB-like protein
VKFSIFGLFALNLIFVCLGQVNKPSIAVNDLIAKGVNATDAEILSERIRVALVNSHAFRVMERGQMAEILKEQGFQKSGACNDKSCIVEVGQLLGVQRILAGTIGKIGTTYEINVSLIDVATGEMLFATTEDCRCNIDEVLQTSTSNIVNKIVHETGSSSDTVSTRGNSTSHSPVPLKTVRHKITPLWAKIATAAIAVGAGIGGYYADTRVQAKVQSNNSAFAAYSRYPTPDAYTTYQTQFNQNCDVAKRYGLYRNILYGLAGLGCAGFAVTFFY